MISALVRRSQNVPTIRCYIASDFFTLPDSFRHYFPFISASASRNRISAIRRSWSPFVL